MKVFVYFNLHKKVYSVRAMEGVNKGRVVAHKRFLVLSDVTGRVSEKGRQRVLREKRKNVHAGLVGEWVERPEMLVSELDMSFITYNPYKNKTFVYKGTGNQFEGSNLVCMSTSNDKPVVMAK